MHPDEYILGTGLIDMNAKDESEIKVHGPEPSKTATTYHRKGFGLKETVEVELKKVYESDLIQQLRASGNELSQNGITIKLAEAFGFCWGVDRAVSMAYETRKHFPDRRIWITNEIIHNPIVNQNLKEMGIQFLEVDQNGSARCENPDCPRGDVYDLAGLRRIY